MDQAGKPDTQPIPHNPEKRKQNKSEASLCMDKG